MSAPKQVAPNCGCTYRCKCEVPIGELHILGPTNYQAARNVRFRENELKTIKNEIAFTFGTIYSHFLEGSDSNRAEIAVIRDELVQLVNTYSEKVETISDMIVREMSTVDFMNKLDRAVAFVETMNREELTEAVKRLKCQLYTFYKIVGS